MISPFPPQFFILLGIDIFLGGSIVTVLFDKEFPNGLPYIFDFGALTGFVQLLIVPGYLANYPVETQFYYSVAFATFAVIGIVACSLYETFRRKPLIGGSIAIVATLPSILALLFFSSAWLNGAQVPLPLLPLLSWPVVWGAFIGASALVSVAMVVIVRGKKNQKLSAEKL